MAMASLFLNTVGCNCLLFFASMFFFPPSFGKSTDKQKHFCIGFQDDASPAALTDLCLTYVSQNLECFCVKLPDGSLCFREAVLFPQELADQLLAKMATEGEPNLYG